MLKRLFSIFMLYFLICFVIISCNGKSVIEPTISLPKEILVSQTVTSTNTPTQIPNINTQLFYPYSTETAAVASSIGYGTPYTGSRSPIQPNNIDSLSMVIAWHKEHLLDWAFTSDSKYLIALGPGHTTSDSWEFARQVIFYNLETNVQERSFPLYYDEELFMYGKSNGEKNYQTYGSALAISPDGNRIAVSLDSPPIIALFDLQGNLLLQSERPEQYSTTNFHPDADELFYSIKGDFLIWRLVCDIFVLDANSLKVVSSTKPYYAETITVSALGTLAAFTYSSSSDLGMKPSDVFLWDFPEPTAVRTISTKNSIASSAAFSPDGKYLAIGTSMDGVEIWQMPETEYLTTLYWDPEQQIQGSAVNILFSPDGSILFVYFGGIKTFWNTQTWSLIRSENFMTPFDYAFAPDGKFFLSKNNEGVFFYAIK